MLFMTGPQLSCFPAKVHRDSILWRPLQTMARIAERDRGGYRLCRPSEKRELPGDGNITTAISHAACTMAADLDVKGELSA